MASRVPSSVADQREAAGEDDRLHPGSSPRPGADGGKDVVGHGVQG